MPRVYTWTDDHIVLMCILEGIPDDLVSDNISMVFLSSQHRTTKYGAWHCSLITDWPPSSSSQVEPAGVLVLHSATSKQHRRHIYHCWATSNNIITKSNAKRHPAATQTNPCNGHNIPHRYWHVTAQQDLVLERIFLFNAFLRRLKASWDYPVIIAVFFPAPSMIKELFPLTTKTSFTLYETMKNNPPFYRTGAIERKKPKATTNTKNPNHENKKITTQC